MQIKDIGYKVCLVYIFSHIFIPYAAFNIFNIETNSIYKQEDVSIIFLIYFVLTSVFFVVFYLFSKDLLINFSNKSNKYSNFLMNSYLKSRPLLGSIYLVISIFLFFNGASDIRYSSGASQQGVIAYIILIMRAIIYFELLLCIFYTNLFRVDQSIEKLITVTVPILISSALLTSGSMDLIIVILAVFAVSSNNTFTKLLLNSSNNIILNLSKYIFSLAIGVILLVISLLLGEAIKSGMLSSVISNGILSSAISFEAISSISQLEYGIEGFLLYLIERISTHYYSLVMALGNFEVNSYKFLSIPFEEFIRRFNLIFGAPFGDIEKGFGTVSRFNYENMTLIPVNLREGTSPGLLATSVYIFGPIVGAFISAVSLILLSSVIDFFLAGFDTKNMSISGIFIVLLIFLFLFESPLDFFIMFDDSLLKVIFITIFASSRMRMRMKENSLSY